MNLKNVTAALALVLAAGSAMANHTDTRLNEILRNPSGGSSGDDSWQYIELKGCGGQDLDGLAVVVVVDSGASNTEIDECFAFNAGANVYKFNTNGYFAIWSTDTDSLGADVAEWAANSSIFPQLPAYNYDSSNGGIKPNPATTGGATTFEVGDFVSPRHEACYQDLNNAQGSEDAGTIASSGSMTVFVIDVEAWRANYNTLHGGALTRQQMLDMIEKDDVYDTGGNGSPNTIFTETLVGGTVPIWELAIIDEVAISNGGGNFEFTRYEANELDFSPDFNADALIRMNDVRAGSADFIPDTTAYGSRLIRVWPAGASDDFRTGYHNWAYGELANNVPGDFTSSGTSSGGWGAMRIPAASSTVYVSYADMDNANYTLTPGYANTSYTANADGAGANESSGGQISVSCDGDLRFDRDGDGVLTVSDVRLLLQGGDSAGAAEAASSLGN